MMRSSVDLPPPLGPSSAVSWPVGMLTDTSSSATKSPKRLLTLMTSMLIWAMLSSFGRRIDTTTMQATETRASRNAVA